MDQQENKSSTSEPIGSKKGCGRNSVNISAMNMISQICFHLYHVENSNDDISSETYIESSYLELEPSI
jgi:hypothetical protein